MNTKNNNTVQRVFTMVHRKGTLVLADNKPNADGRPTAKAYKVAPEEMELFQLEKLISLITSIPAQRMDRKVAILLPRSVSFLSYQDTRSYWLVNGVKKNGDVVSPEKLALVAQLDVAIKAKAHNTYFICQSKITSAYYKSIVNGVWKYMDSKEAPDERLSSMDF